MSKMDDNNNNDNKLDKSGPVCPYCEADPINFAIGNGKISNQLNSITYAIVFCANKECRKIFNIEILEILPNKSITVPSIHSIRKGNKS